MAFEQYQGRRSGQGTGDIVLGLILIIVGIGITMVTHDHASRQGGTYIVAFGPIIVGVLRLFRGIAASAS